MSSSAVCPKRFGLNYDPPSIVLEYLEVSTGKLFHRRVGLRRLRASSDPARVAEKLRQKNRALLAEDSVSFDQIVCLVKKLQESLSDKAAAAVNGLTGGLNRSAPPQRDAFDYQKADLNKLSEAELTQHKERMDVAFLKNQKKPGDAGYEYDVQVDFPDGENENDWDSEEDLDVIQRRFSTRAW
ncbi:unnamed protein product [Polarella glacialis]|uniref:Centrosomal protein of 19 kDa n=1 Tax=Polarella glacialis TaxID=89957 RepID=A0A813DZV0_POLGL|nr:unnamed protein product [Polarella glacialis]